MARTVYAIRLDGFPDIERVYFADSSSEAIKKYRAATFSTERVEATIANECHWCHRYFVIDAMGRRNACPRCRQIL